MNSLRSEEAGVSRRDFVRGAALVGAVTAGAAALTGCSGSSASELAELQLPEAWDDTADVVVIGCGTSIGAALSAAETGASVIVLEKTGTAGGNWAINEGVYWAPATDAMTANGEIDPRTGAADTIDGAMADWMTATGGVGNQELLRIIMEEQQKFINGLVADGVKFTHYIPGAAPVARAHIIEGKPFGGYFVQLLKDKLAQTNVKMMLQTKGRKLLRDKTGSVVGVEAVDTGGNSLYIGAKAVIVATGSYQANQEMLARYNPETAGWACVGGAWATGDGQRMLFDLDAAAIGFHPQVSIVTAEKYTGSLIQSEIEYDKFWATPRSVIFVNNVGERFRDESLGYVLADPTTLTNPVYGIFDQAQFDEEDFKLGTAWTRSDLQSAVENGWVKKADTIADLAALLYLDSARLQKSVDDFNAGIASGVDPFGRPASMSRALVAPFYAWTAPKGIIGQALGCIEIDTNGSVIDIDGKVIPGVYAASNDMVYYNFEGASYIASGTACSCGHALGVHVGRTAAAYALSL